MTTLNSTWNITKIEYADVVEDADGLTVQTIETTYSSTEGWSTSAAEALSIAEFVTRYDCTNTKERALKLSTSKYLSKDSTGAWVVSTDNTSNAYSAAESKTYKIDFIENHNHLYGTSSAEANKASFVGNDSKFRLMSFLGNNLLDDTNHYVYCDECGLEYYPVAHVYDTSTGRTDEQKATCTKCGYYTNSYFKVTIEKSNDPNTMDAAEAALTAARTAWKYGGAATTKFSESTKGSEAATQMQIVANALKAADDVLSKMGKTDENGARAAIKTLLTANTESDPDASIVDAIKAAAASGSTVLTTQNVTDYTTVLLAAENALIGQETDTASTTVSSVSAANCVVKEIKDWVNITATGVDSFFVKKGTVLELGYDKYTTSREIEYSFAENTGWLIGDNTKLQLTADGFKVLWGPIHRPWCIIAPFLLML